MLNENIKAGRRHCGLTQAEFGELVKVSIDTVRRWETGKQEPRAWELQCIAEILRTSVDELLKPSRGQIKLILDKKGEMLMSINLTGATDKFIGVSKNEIVLHLKAPIRTESELDELLKEFKKIGMDGLDQQKKWREEDEEGRVD